MQSKSTVWKTGPQLVFAKIHEKYVSTQVAACRRKTETSTILTREITFVNMQGHWHTQALSKNSRRYTCTNVWIHVFGQWWELEEVLSMQLQENCKFWMFAQLEYMTENTGVTGRISFTRCIWRTKESILLVFVLTLLGWAAWASHQQVTA